MQTLAVRPEWSASAQPFRHTWEGVVNIDQFRWMVRRDVQEQLALACRELGARHVRAVGIFDDEMRVYGKDPRSFLQGGHTLHVNWQLVDYVIQSLLDIGISPMITTTFVPSEMASGTRTVFATKAHVSPPKDWNQWSELVRGVTQHFVDQFGRDVVRGWYFEVWNEPNLRAFFDGDQQTFYKLWNTTWRAIKSVDPSIRVGGPSGACAEWIGELIEYGRQHGCAPDYIVAHIYNNDSDHKPLSPFDGPQEDKVNRSPHFAAGVVRGTRKLLTDLDFTGELHFNEWGRSWHPFFPDRETANEAAYIVKTMSEVSQLADAFAYWNLSDIYDQVGYGAQAFHGNYGLLNLHSLRKPPYHAFQLLSRLGTLRVPVAPQASNALEGAIATTDADGRRRSVLCYRYTPDRDQPSARVDVTLPEAFDDRGPLILYRVTDTENNILADWQRLGSPAYLRRDQLLELQARNLLCPAPPGALTLRAEGATTLASFDLPAPGIAWVAID